MNQCKHSIPGWPSDPDPLQCAKLAGHIGPHATEEYIATAGDLPDFGKPRCKSTYPGSATLLGKPIRCELPTGHAEQHGHSFAARYWNDAEPETPTLAVRYCTPETCTDPRCPNFSFDARNRAGLKTRVANQRAHNAARDAAEIGDADNV